MPRSDCHLKARELQHLEAKFEKLIINFFTGFIRSITCNTPLWGTADLYGKLKMAVAHQHFYISVAAAASSDCCHLGVINCVMHLQISDLKKEKWTRKRTSTSDEFLCAIVVILLILGYPASALVGTWTRDLSLNKGSKYKLYLSYYKLSKGKFY